MLGLRNGCNKEVDHALIALWLGDGHGGSRHKIEQYQRHRRLEKYGRLFVLRLLL